MTQTIAMDDVDTTILRMFRVGKRNTAEIARELHSNEAFIARRLAAIRDLERAQKSGARPA
jgi:hypothetical protein